MRNYNLTPSEVKVLNLLVEGLTNPEIGDILSITLQSVKNYVTHIYSKLEVKNRVQATRKWVLDVEMYTVQEGCIK